jgi:hypothetical protein
LKGIDLKAQESECRQADLGREDMFEGRVSIFMAFSPWPSLVSMAHVLAGELVGKC